MGWEGVLRREGKTKVIRKRWSLIE